MKSSKDSRHKIARPKKSIGSKHRSEGHEISDRELLKQSMAEKCKS